ncbi:MAG: aminotransferase class I/II-fold pyridoxal phosphate-dependent enzyme, partial [Pseudomonadota bacterium]
MSEQIDKIRNQIDGLDDQLHQLIQTREQLILAIREAKSAAHHQDSKGQKNLNHQKQAPYIPLRPAREFKILQRLLTNHQSAFPVDSLVRIWHEMMGAYSQALQAPYKIAIDPYIAQNAKLYSLARDQYAIASQLDSCHRTSEIFDHLTRQKNQHQTHAIGLFANATNAADATNINARHIQTHQQTLDQSLSHQSLEPQQDWWCNRRLGQDLHVIQVLPTLRTATAPSDLIYALSSIKLEPCGHDRVFIRFSDLDSNQQQKLLSEIKHYWAPSHFDQVKMGHAGWILIAEQNTLILSFGCNLSASLNPIEALKTKYPNIFKPFNATLIGIAPLALSQNDTQSQINKMPKPKANITLTPKYIPGKHGTNPRQSIILSANENPLGPGSKALSAFKELTQQNHADFMSRYPDGSAHLLRQAIAKAHLLNDSQIICSAGSDELINLLAQCYSGQGDQILYSQYGFLMYPIAATLAG